MASQESKAVREILLKQKAALSAQRRASIAELRQSFEEMFGNRPLEPDVRVERVTINGIPGEWVTAPNAAGDCVFLYLHGGGYCLGSCHTHRALAAKLSRATAARALVIEYRLAPEHPFPAAIEDAATAYRWLISAGISPKHIVVGGDSAGGGLTVATLIVLRDAGDPLPAAAVLLSPWTDMECSGESMKTRAATDPFLDPEGIKAMAAVYTRNVDPRHPLVSPIHADLRGLPPMLVHVGEDECLLDDAVRLVARARAAGVEVAFKIWEGMWHVFHAFAPNVPEATQAVEEVGAYVRGKLGLP